MRRPVIGALLLVILGVTVACSSTPPVPGPTPEPPPPPAVTGSATVPAEVLDLRNWYLTLPTGEAGDPDTVDQPQLATYSSRWFDLDPARDGVVFTADVGGVTTDNSNYPRSELREMDGSEKASWSNESGTHTMTVRQAVVALPVFKPDIVTAQIHDEKSDVVEIRLQTNQLIAQYGNGKTNAVLDPAYVLGTPYEIKIVAADSRIQVFYNGVMKVEIPESGSGWYFKSGAYVQSNTSKGDKPDTVGSVVLYQLSVTHSA